MSVLIPEFRSWNSRFVRICWEIHAGKLRKAPSEIEEVLARKVEEEYLSECNCGDPKPY
jgi:hypothetical protein